MMPPISRWVFEEFPRNAVGGLTAPRLSAPCGLSTRCSMAFAISQVGQPQAMYFSDIIGLLYGVSCQSIIQKDKFVASEPGTSTPEPQIGRNTLRGGGRHGRWNKT